MAYQHVTCPETRLLELIEIDETPCGTLVLDCSSFHPACGVDCPRSCAARLDGRDPTPHAEATGAREREDEIDERVLGVGDSLCLDVLGLLRVRGGVAACTARRRVA